MIRRYETILLFDIDAGEESRDSFISKSKALIEQYEGNLLEQDEWGVRKLAYEVQKKTRGYYVRLEYCAKTELIAEYERIIRLEDAVMKYITVMIDEAFDPDAYATAQAELAQPTDEDPADFSESPDMQDSAEMLDEMDHISEMPDDTDKDSDMDDHDDSHIDLSPDSDVSDDTTITEESKKED